MKGSIGHTHRQLMIALAANLSLLGHGLLSGWMSPMSTLLRSEDTPTQKPLTDGMISWIAAAFCLSAALTVGLYAFVADIWGRKIAMVFVIMFQASSWIIKLCTSSEIGLIVARIVAGVSGGGCFNIIPMYVKEISHNSIRGRLGTLTVMCQNVGVLIVYTLGSYVSYKTLICAALVVPALNFVCLVRSPESPAFLVKMGNDKKAAKVLAYLRGLSVDHKEVQKEIQSLRNENINKAKKEPITFRDIFTNIGYIKAFFVVLVLITVQASNGMMVILAFAASIMSDAGVTYNPQLQTMSFPAIMILGALVSMVLMERAGRKILFISSVGLSSVSLGTLAVSLQIQHSGGATPQWIPVATIMVTAFAYATGVCTVPYVVMAEIFNFKLRSKLIGIIVTHAWLVSFTQLLSFSIITSYFGLHTVIFWYAGVNLLGGVFAVFFLPETKGKSIEEIETYFRKQ